MKRIGLGGGCHWCTEAVFQALKGVISVQQGWINTKEDAFYSEAILLDFDESIITLSDLIEIHLHTHSCTSSHAMRQKYRSAVYLMNSEEIQPAQELINQFQKDFDESIITKAQHFYSFKLNQEKYLDYYKKNPEKAFCTTYITPKLQKLMLKFSPHLKVNN